MKFKVYDTVQEQYLFDRKKFSKLVDVESALHDDFLLGDEREFVWLGEMMAEAKLELHFDNGRIVKDYDQAVEEDFNSMR
jgi:hypothetical protein